jgi:hypothetical protein
VSKLLAALALVMMLAQSSGALALAGVDACSAPCAGESRDAGCVPAADCCACCAVPPSASTVRPALAGLPPISASLPSERALRPPRPAPADVFHVPLRASA